MLPFALDPVLYLDARYGVTTDGADQVTAWADQSGNGHELVQSNPSLQPTYLATGGIGGGPSLVFTDGAGEVLNELDTIIYQQPNTVWAVVSRESAIATRVLVDGAAGVRNGLLYGAGGTLNLFAGSLVAGPSMPTDTPIVVAGVFDGAASIARVNGTNSSPINPGTQALERFLVGSFGGQIASVLIFNRALSSGELAELDRWATIEWGIAL